MIFQLHDTKMHKTIEQKNVYNFQLNQTMLPLFLI